MIEIGKERGGEREREGGKKERGYIHVERERDTISNSTVTETGESNPKQVFGPGGIRTCDL
jgi:hypothetical protein